MKAQKSNQTKMTGNPDCYYDNDDTEAIRPKTIEQLAALAREQQAGNLETTMRLNQMITRELQAALEQVGAQPQKQSQDLETDGA